MSRAAKPCNQHGCPNLAPCPVHRPPAWVNSTRRTKTGSGWEQQRRAQRVMRRYSAICHVCGQPEADAVDHVIPLSENGPDTEDNMRPIHKRPCHVEKTAAESARAKNR